MSIPDLLPRNAICVPLEVSDKQEAIDLLIDQLANGNHIDDADEMKRVVWDRESQRSTGIGEGLAIPHGKSPDLVRLVMAIGVLAEPIDFDSIDGKPVRLIALLLSPANRIGDHIQALGRISRLMANPTVREAAYCATSPEELYELIERASN